MTEFLTLLGGVTLSIVCILVLGLGGFLGVVYLIHRAIDRGWIQDYCSCPKDAEGRKVP